MTNRHAPTWQHPALQQLVHHSALDCPVTTLNNTRVWFIIHNTPHSEYKQQNTITNIQYVNNQKSLAYILTDHIQAHMQEITQWSHTSNNTAMFYMFTALNLNPNPERKGLGPQGSPGHISWKLHFLVAFTWQFLPYIYQLSLSSKVKL